MNKAAPRLDASLPFAHAGAKRNRRAACAAALMIIIGLSGCSKGMSDVTGSIGKPQAPAKIPTEEGALRRFADEWGRRYDATPKDKVVAMTYARALHGLDQNTQAVAVLQNTAIQNPTDMEVLGAYGKALADAGRLTEAADVLNPRPYARAAELVGGLDPGNHRRRTRRPRGRARILSRGAENPPQRSDRPVEHGPLLRAVAAVAARRGDAAARRRAAGRRYARAPEPLAGAGAGGQIPASRGMVAPRSLADRGRRQCRRDPSDDFAIQCFARNRRAVIPRLVPALPGCVIYGRTVDEAREMAKDAISGYIASLRKHKDPIPTDDNTLVASLDLEYSR